jgi:uridine kinase
MEENHNKPSLLIGITGGSGSGKTTFINALRKEFRSSELCIVSQDDYYRPRDEQKIDEKGIKNFDIPYSIELDDFHNDIIKLLNGEVVRRKEYVFNNENASPKDLVFHPAPIILIEGLFVFSEEKIRKLINLKLFIDAHENLKVIRRIRRDREERNYPLDDVLYRYEKHVLPSYQKYIEPFRNIADVIINNNSDFQKGLELLVGYMKYRLK